MKSKFYFGHSHALFCILMLAALTFNVKPLKAQNGVGINGTGAPADPSAGLDVDYPDKGVLIPRVNLLVTSIPSPVTNPVTGLLVYNKATINDVAPGFYYWNGTLWVPITPNIAGDPDITCGVGNLYYTLRGDGNGGYVCTNTLQVAPGYVGINIAPSSSYRLRVSGTTSLSGSVYIAGTFGSSFNSSGTLSMNGNAITMGAGTISTTGAVTVGSLNVGTSGVQIASNGSISTTGGNISTGGGAIGLGSGSLSTSGNMTVGGILTASTLRCGGGSASGTACIRTSSGTITTTSSTIRVKENVQPLTINKEKLFKIQPVSYKYKKACGGENDIGAIAEQVGAVVPELVYFGPQRIWPGDSGICLKSYDGIHDSTIHKDILEPYHINYDKIGLFLVPVVAEQDKIIQQQQKELADLKKRLELLEQLIAGKYGDDPALRNTGAVLPKENPTLEAVLPKK